MNVRIFCLERGYILVADWEQDADPQFLCLKKSSIVRIWGTTKGLGELAKNGPIKGKTILDDEPEGGRLNKDKIIREVACVQKAWKSWME